MKSIAASSSWLVPCLYMFVVLLAPRAANANRGSTPHLRQIVLGRCWDYQAMKFGSDVKKWKNCTEISEAFYRAFAFRNPCQLTFADYKPYFDAVGMAENIDKSLFWSGTYKAVHSYSDFDSRFTTLEDTMAGWIVNGLTWCGNRKSASSTSGIDYDSCPDNCYQGIDAFWGQASKMFAQSASGLVRVMVNGSRFDKDGKPSPSYKNNSYFGRFELPYMNVTRVTKLIVIVVHTVGGKILEKCGTKSVKLLETLAKERGLTTECVDDPPAVKHILCTDYPNSPECLFHGGESSLATDCGTWKAGVVVIGVVAGVLLVAIVIMLLRFCRRLKKEDDLKELVNSEYTDTTENH